MKKIITLLFALTANITLFAQDIIVTTDAKKFETKITEVSKSEIKYKELDNLDGPTFVLGVDEINSVIYANGKVVIYNQSDKTQEFQKVSNRNVQPAVPYNTTDHNMARVSNYSGVLVFTDCIPVAQYEVLGEVNSANISSNKESGFIMSSKDMLIIDEGDEVTPQYPDIRHQLITNAVMANRQVEGIIISLPKAGEGRATLIKFTNNSDDKYLAKVNSHQGVLVFTDCAPLNKYTFVGKIDKAGGTSPDYSAIRDRLIKKVQKKFPDVQGIITRLVSGGHDSAEAIKF